MKYYFAVFKKTSEAIEVTFPDLEGCVTFGQNWDEAFSNAEDVLAAWLANADAKFILAPSSFEDLNKTYESLVPIPINETILSTYQEPKRFNVIFPAKILKAIDDYRRKVGMKRSTLLQKAAEEYLEQHN